MCTKKGAIDAPMCCLGEQQRVGQITQLHTIAKLSHEELSAIVEANEPLIVLLEYTLTCNTMLTENSIDARFGGVRLPTTIKQTHIVLTYVCNVVAVQIHFRLTSFGVKLYTSVCFGPVEIVADGSIHLTFDLAGHVKRFVNLRVVWRRWGAIATPCVTLDQLVSDCLHNVAVFAYDVTEGVSDVGIGVGLVMHSEADVHGTIQIGRGFGLAQSRAGDSEVVHADIIGTGGDALGVRLCH
jgi:hypothetical protein